MAEGPWIKFYPSDWLTGTRGLTASEIGVYVTLIAMMYEKGAPIVLDSPKLARACGIPAASFAKVIKSLIDGGKLNLEGGGLFHERVRRELQARKVQSDSASKSAKIRWEKDKENQPSKNASEERSASTRVRDQISESRYQKEEPPSEVTREREPTPKQILLTILDEETANAVLQHRKAVKAPLTTALAARTLVKRFQEYPDGPKAAVELMLARGWRGFEREYWDKGQQRAGPAPQGESPLERRKQALRERIENEHGVGRQGSGSAEDDGLFRAISGPPDRRPD